MNQCCVRSIIQLILSWMQFTVLVFCAVSIKVHFPHHFSHRNLDELTLKIIFLQTSYFSQEYIKHQTEQT